MSSLQEQGFKFVLQGGNFNWLHPADIKHDAIDCTEMPDAEFASLVSRTEYISLSENV